MKHQPNEDGYQTNFPNFLLKFLFLPFMKVIYKNFFKNQKMGKMTPHNAN